MSWGTDYLIGYQTGFNAEMQRQQLRQQAIDRNNALRMKGYEVDDAGNITGVIPNSQTDVMQQQFKQHAIYLKSLNDKILKMQTANYLAHSIKTGNFDNLNNFIKQNTDIQQAIGALGVSAIRTFNPNTDMNLVTKYGLDKEYLNDENFNKKYFVVIGEDGQPDLRSSDSLIAMTGSQYMMAAQDFDAINKILHPDLETQQKLNQLKIQDAEADIEQKKVKEEQIKAQTDLIKKQTENIGKPNPIQQIDLALKQMDLKDKSLKYQADYFKTHPDVVYKAIENVNLDNFKDIEKSKDFSSLLNAAKATQGDKTLTESQRNVINGNLNTTKVGIKLLDKINKLHKQGKFDRNAVEALKVTIGKFIGIDSGKSPEEIAKAEKLATELGVKSELQELISQYILAMSGQGVTEEEYKRRLESLTGGNFSDYSAFEKIFKGFLSGVTENAKSTLENIKTIYPYSYLNYARELSKVDTSKLDYTKSNRPSLDNFMKDK